MAKNTPKIQEIDNTLKDIVRSIRFSDENIFESNYTLVMDNAPVMKVVERGVPMRSTEHRVILVRSGSVDYSLNFTDYHVMEGDVLMVPANYVITVEDFRPTTSARVLAFRFVDMADAALIGFDVVHLHLGQFDQQVFENFFQMMHNVLTVPTSSRHDFEHLVLSMLFRIRDINARQNGVRTPVLGDHKQQVFTHFMQLLNQADTSTPRTVSAYAERLGVTNNYLSIIVKELSERTVMDWVDMRSLQLIKMRLTDENDATIDMIAEQMGYTSSSQMIRFFKRMTGMTPDKFRKSKSKQ